MKYRVHIDMSFDEESPAIELVKIAKKLIPYASNINEGKDNQEIGFIDYRESNHDDPTRTIPDKVIEHLDVGKPIVTPSPIIATEA